MKLKTEKKEKRDKNGRYSFTYKFLEKNRTINQKIKASVVPYTKYKKMAM